MTADIAMLFSRRLKNAVANEKEGPFALERGEDSEFWGVKNASQRNVNLFWATGITST